MDTNVIRIDRLSRMPLHVQIRNQVREMIYNGGLLEGKLLPPTRKLAQILGLNRSTVVEAYSELMSEGLIDARVGKGTFVVGKLLGEKKPGSTEPLKWQELCVISARSGYDSIIKDTLDQLSKKDVISLAAGVPAPEYYPIREFQKIIFELIAREGAAVLHYMPAEGYFSLREMIGRWMNEDGVPCRANDVLITSGAIQGLALVTRTLVEPGDLVLVERPTFMGGLQILQASGARIIDVPMDAEGMRLDILENLLARHRPKLIYSLPTYQNPSGAVLSLERRKRLLDLAYQHQVPIIEEDAYSKIFFQDAPPPLLKAMDRHNHVIHVGTFSKVLFPGLRLGWVAASRPLIDRLTRTKQYVDLHSNSLGQYAIYEFCRRGSLEAHLMRIRKAYARRKDAMISALRRHGAGLVGWTDPSGGFYLWCRLKEGLSTRDLLRELFYEKVAVLAGDVFFLEDESTEWFRLNFTSQCEETIEEGVRRIGRALKRLKRRAAVRPEKNEDATRTIV